MATQTTDTKTITLSKSKKTPKEPKAINVSNAPKATKAINVSKAPKAPKAPKTPKAPKLSKIDLFLKLGNFNENNNTTCFVNKDEFIDEYATLSFNNGGNWCRNSSLKKKMYKLATMKTNGKINYLWDATDEEKQSVEADFKANCKIIKGNSQVYYFKIFGIKNEESGGHPISKDILEYYKKIPCVNCGSKAELQCDHKNGLYNDPRVLDIKTQTKDDFQSLCRHCNCQKRQIEKKTRETSKRYGATNIPSLAIFNIDFIEGDDTVNLKDINALKGTYWYDPIEFMKHIKISISISKNK